ncbi:unnamed protein product [Cylicocyclus nassatus]|uniref:SAM domain-containing protein n=1 Tax=Cylicocyclus nassatus TaxID=53992 RepID=A0AA36DLZ5_CYLNA|nr:unnamed protein product [Cylicocyclus nassatus]
MLMKIFESMWDWHSFFTKIGIPAGVSSRYAEVFRQNRVTKDMLPDLDKATLSDLGVTAVGDQLAILRSAKDASLDMGSITPSKLRVRISGPGSNSEGSSSSTAVSNGEARRGKPPPDRHEIYHIKMPEGNTHRTKQIMQNAIMMRKHGLAVRGTSGVRQGGRSVSPIDKKSAAVVRMRQEREEMLVDDPIISRLGVRGLHSDIGEKPAITKSHKQSIRNARWPEVGDDVAVRVQLPSRSGGVVRRISKAPRTGVSTSIVNRISKNRSSELPRVTVKLRGAAPREKLIVRPRVVARKPLQARLGKVATAGRLDRPRVVQRPFVRADLDEADVDDEEMSLDDEEYSTEDAMWDDGDDQYEEVEYVEEVRPSVYNRLSH